MHALHCICLHHHKLQSLVPLCLVLLSPADKDQGAEGHDVEHQVEPQQGQRTLCSLQHRRCVRFRHACAHGSSERLSSTATGPGGPWWKGCACAMHILKAAEWGCELHGSHGSSSLTVAAAILLDCWGSAQGSTGRDPPTGAGQSTSGSRSQACPEAICWFHWDWQRCWQSRQMPPLGWGTAALPLQ